MRIVSRHVQPCLHAFTAALLIGGCASSPPIHRETNPAATFASYRTFGFYSPLATDKASYESMFSQHLKDATRRMMESKGYVYSERGADLLLNFYVNVQDRQEIRSTPGTAGSAYGYPGGYYGYRGGYYRSFGAPTVETVNYKQGTLTIDLVDARQKALAWTATVEGRISYDAIRNPGPAIDTLVTNMMAPVPDAVK